MMQMLSPENLSLLTLLSSSLYGGFPAFAYRFGAACPGTVVCFRKYGYAGYDAGWTIHSYVHCREKYE